MFYEPLGTNPMIRLYRRLTPRLRSPDEHPLVDADVDLARRSFAVVALEPTRSWPSPGSSSAACLGVAASLRCSTPHRWLFGAPLTRRLAWTAVVRLADPTPS